MLIGIAEPQSKIVAACLLHMTWELHEVILRVIMPVKGGFSILAIEDLFMHASGLPVKVKFVTGHAHGLQQQLIPKCGMQEPWLRIEQQMTMLIT